MKALPAPRQLRLTELLSFPDKSCTRDVGDNERIAQQDNEHVHANPIYLPLDLCRPLGSAHHFYSGLAVGACVWKLESMLVAHEARSFLMEEIGKCITNQVDHASVAPNGQLWSKMVTDYVDPEGRWLQCSMVDSTINNSFQIEAPSLMSVMESLTPLMATDSVNSEKLTLLGDSLLKVYAVLEIFLFDTHASPCDLTNQRRSLTSYDYMSSAYIKTGFARYLRPMNISGGDLYLQHRPSGMMEDAVKNGRSVWSSSFVVDGASATAAPASLCNAQSDEIKKKKKRKNKSKKSKLSVSTLDEVDSTDIGIAVGRVIGEGKEQHLRVSLQTKHLADLVKSTAGSFYLSGGWPAGVAVLRVLLCIDQKNFACTTAREEQLANEIKSLSSLKGGCSCGNIRYKSAGPSSHFFVCHCSQCPVKDWTFSHPVLGNGAPWVAVPPVDIIVIKLIQFQPAWALHTLLRFKGLVYECECQQLLYSMG